MTKVHSNANQFKLVPRLTSITHLWSSFAMNHYIESQNCAVKWLKDPECRFKQQKEVKTIWNGIVYPRSIKLGH